jgi:hypothetical protein
MLDDEQQEAPEAEGDDDAADAGGTGSGGDAGDPAGEEAAGGDAGEAGDAIDIADVGAAEVETADEPAVSAEELLEMPDAPERWGEEGKIIDPDAAGAGDERATEAAELGAQAAAEGETPAPSDDQEASE